MHNGKRLVTNLCPSLTEEVLQKLTGRGIRNVIDFLLSDLSEVATNSGINLIILQNIKQTLCASNAVFPKSGSELLAQRIRGFNSILTGYRSLDQLLGEGLKGGELVEIYGPSGSGKTRLCLKIGLDVSLMQREKVLFFDPLASISTILRHLVEQLAQKHKIEISTLDNFQMVVPHNVWEVLTTLESIHGGSGEVPRLIIIDSFPFLMYPLMSGGGASSYAFGLLNHVIKLMKTVAKERNLTILVINYCVKSDDDPAGAPGETKPALGRMWAYAPQTRLLMENVMTDSPGKSGIVGRRMTVVKSTNLPESHSCILQL